jgi:hypothetical protein
MYVTVDENTMYRSWVVNNISWHIPYHTIILRQTLISTNTNFIRHINPIQMHSYIWLLTRRFVKLLTMYYHGQSGYVPLVVATSRSFPHSRLITGFVTKLTRLVPLVDQELPTLPEHLNLPPVLSGVHVTRSLVWYVCCVDLVCPFVLLSFSHCVVCPSSIYGFWLPLWYLQTLL